MQNIKTGILQILNQLFVWWKEKFGKSGCVGKTILVCLSLLAIICLCSVPFAIFSPSKEASEVAPTPRDISIVQSSTSLLPEYSVFSDKSYEDAGTVKIIWEILVSSDIEKESLNTLLKELYVEALSKTSNSNGLPIVIDIKAYTSEEHATSGMAQWIGWVSKNGGDTEPTFSFNEGQLDSINETPEMKFGLSEIARQQIWEDIVRVEDKAEKEALQQYPDMQPFNEFEKSENELVLKYKLELAEETGLTLEQLDEIAVEGLMKNWAFPQK